MKRVEGRVDGLRELCRGIFGARRGHGGFAPFARGEPPVDVPHTSMYSTEFENHLHMVRNFQLKLWNRSRVEKVFTHRDYYNARAVCQSSTDAIITFFSY